MLRLRTLLPVPVIFLASAAALAGDPKTLADLLPANTPAYLETTNPPMEELKKTAIYACMQEPALKKALDRLFSGDMTSQAIPIGSGAVIVKSDFRDGSVEVRFLQKSGSHVMKIKNHFSVAWIGLADGPIPVDAVAALGVENPKEALATAKHIVAALWMEIDGGGRQGNIAETIGRIFSDSQHEGVGYTQVTLGDVSLYITTLGKLLIVATTEARIKESIERTKDGGKHMPPLSQHPRYTDLVKSAKGTGSATTVMALQVDTALDVLSQALPGPIAMVRGGMASMGMGGLKSFSSVSRIDGRGITNTVSILLDRKAGSPGAPSIASTAGALFRPGKPTKAESLAFAPKDSIYVNCMGFSGKGLGALWANPAAAGVFQDKFALRLREDLLDLMGDEIGVIVAPNNGLIPDFALVIQSSDAEHLNRSFVRMARAMPWTPNAQMQKATIRGTTVHVLPMFHPNLGSVPLAPTFGVIGDKVLITPSPAAFGRFAAVAQGDAPAITENRDFAKLREMVPASAEGLSYFNLPRAIAFLYDTVVPFLQSMPQPKGATPLYELPESELFTRHLYGRIAWTVSDKRGWHWISHAPIDMSGFMIAGAVGAGVVLLYAREAEAQHVPAPIRAERPDQQAMQCSANVRMLKARIRFYRRQKKALPKSLNDLKADYLPEDTFIVPGTGKPYVYLGPKGKGRVLLHGSVNGKDKRICVLTRRLQVMRVSAKDLKKMLNAQQAATKPR